MDGDDTCRVYISPERPVCGDDAVADVIVYDRKMNVKASVPMCNKHTGEYDRKSALFRVASKR